MNSRTTLALFALVFFLVGSWANLEAPLTYWDQANLLWASSAGIAPTQTSLLYLVLLRTLGAVGLISVPLLRHLQAAGVLLTVPMIYLLVRQLWGANSAGSVAVALYLLSPATVQGTQSLALADASYLPAVFCAWAVCYLRTDGGRWPDMLVLVVLSAIAFGVKSTSSLGLLLVPMFGLALARSKTARRDQLLKLVAAVIGLGLFSFVWAVTSMYLRVGAMVGEASEGLSTAPDPVRLAFHLAVGVAWWGPFMALLTAAGALFLWRDADHQRRALVCGVSAYCVAYLAVGGMNHGYPRYYMAVLPIFCAIAVGPIAPAVPRFRDLLIALLAAALLLFVGDPILGLNLGVRRAVIEGTLGSHLAGESLRWMFWAVVPVVVAWAGLPTWRRRILSASIASFVALGTIQIAADYTTGYEYGGSGRETAVERIRRGVSVGGAVVAPPSVSARLKSEGLVGMSHADWRNRESIRAYMARSMPQALLLGITENSLDQLRWFLEEPPGVFAGCSERFEQIGTYWLCFATPSRGR
ncbi:MAG: hypothetical protein V3T28_00390 [Gemmatimonadales bacterium]